MTRGSIVSSSTQFEQVTVCACVHRHAQLNSPFLNKRIVQWDKGSAYEVSQPVPSIDYASIKQSDSG